MLMHKTVPVPATPDRWAAMLVQDAVRQPGEARTCANAVACRRISAARVQSQAPRIFGAGHYGSADMPAVKTRPSRRGTPAVGVANLRGRRPKDRWRGHELVDRRPVLAVAAHSLDLAMGPAFLADHDAALLALA